METSCAPVVLHCGDFSSKRHHRWVDDQVPDGTGQAERCDAGVAGDGGGIGWDEARDAGAETEMALLRPGA